MGKAGRSRIAADHHEQGRQHFNPLSGSGRKLPDSVKNLMLSSPRLFRKIIILMIYHFMYCSPAIRSIDPNKFI